MKQQLKFHIKKACNPTISDGITKEKNKNSQWA